MKKIIERILSIFANRSLILMALTVIIGIIYLLQLFNLQIVKGKEYRDQSEKKMLRTENIVAARGEIYDRNGVILATNKFSFDVLLYKVKVDDAKLNESLKKLVDILNSNGDRITSSFPINEELNNFNFDNADAEKKWKKDNKISEDYSFNQTIDYFINKYNLNEFDRNIAIKIIQIRYEANYNGYSLFKSVTVSKDISDKSVAIIEETKSELYGVKTICLPKRYYPYGTLAAHTIGYVSKMNSDEYNSLKDQGYTYNSTIGKLGIEQTFEKYLKGTDGAKRFEVDSMGVVASEKTVTEAVAGDNVTLTIDYRLQKVAEESLAKTINDIKTGTKTIQKSADADSGAVVVLDTLTGEVLAIASYPTFDINQFVGGISTKMWNSLINDSVKPMYNRAISGTYSPGSTFKMLVGLAGLQKGVITTTEKIQDTGIYQYGYHPKCWIYEMHGTTHGYVNITQAIKVSCNVFFYEVGRRLGIDNIVEYAKMFGLGEKTGIELANESSGQIAGNNQKEWYLGDTLSAAIGQSYNSYTPVQLANYIATIANGGNLNKVTLLKNIQDNNQNVINLQDIEQYIKQYTGEDFVPKKIDINPSYIDAIKQGMLSVTSEVGGTSYIVFKNSNIQVAGKTGTAQVSSGSNNGIFVGFAPYDKPRIAVVAIIEHGGEGTYTANVVKPIMEEYFNITKQDQDSEKEQNVVDKGIKF